MPNWCFNVLKLESGAAILPVIKDYLSIQDGVDFLDFEKIVPYPSGIKKLADIEDKYFRDSRSMSEQKKKRKLQEIEALEKKNKKEYGFESWLNWCIKNWGTKWNSCDCFVDEYCISFNTAWNSPDKVIKKLSQKINESLILYYYESGMGFCGKLSVGPDGEEVDDFYDNPRIAPFEIRDILEIHEDEEDE